MWEIKLIKRISQLANTQMLNKIGYFKNVGERGRRGGAGQGRTGHGGGAKTQSYEKYFRDKKKIGQIWP